MGILPPSARIVQPAAAEFVCPEYEPPTLDDLDWWVAIVADLYDAGDFEPAPPDSWLDGLYADRLAEGGRLTDFDIYPHGTD